MGSTVWFTFETPGRGIINVDAITAGVRNPDGSVSGEFKPALALYTGSDPSHLSQVGCQTGGNATNVAGSNLPGGRYWVQLGGVGGASGRLDLDVDIWTTDRKDTRSGAVLDSSGCTRNSLNRNDDGSTGRISLPFALNYFGHTYDSLFVNNNGNVTFDAPLSTFTPFGLTTASRAIIAPFFADVDTRGVGSDIVRYGYGDVAFQGRQAFCVNWVNVGYYSGHFDVTNSFQLLLVDRSDRAAGSFDIVFNYDRVLWETGDASGGRGGRGGSPARAGYSNGTDVFGSHEFPGSGISGAFLDTDESTGLIHGHLGSPQLGRYVFTVDSGHPKCGQDWDCDGVRDSSELKIGTNPRSPDTDGDGLTDGAEIEDRRAPEAAISAPNGTRYTASDLFGPFGPDDTSRPCDDTTDDNLHPIGQWACLNQRPDPLVKDVFVEIDYQDCEEGGCPNDVAGFSFDPLHHAPNLTALRDLVRMYAAAPVTSPGGEGVRLHLLVDEAMPHSPNCDQLPSVQRPQYFGTVHQRRDPALLALRAKLVRYVWSGHSTRHDNSHDCANPSGWNFIKQGYGRADMADYDNTPFGQSARGGDTALITLSPMWNCPSVAKIDPFNPGDLGPCYRETELNPIFPDLLAHADLGIFPAHVEGKSRRWPVSLLLGEHEFDGGRQLWSRALARTLGRTLGLADAELGNDPAPAGRHQFGTRSKLAPLAPDSYARWSGLTWAPNGPGGEVGLEDQPPYDALATTSQALSDPDNDGALEGYDNCPGTYNPTQSNTDFGMFGLRHNDAEFGDACDPDIDGDGQFNTLPGDGEVASAIAGGGGRMAGTVSAAGPALDPYPYDTDNDSADNVSDSDDDGDGRDDEHDNCVLIANATQADQDHDATGDACDADVDGDDLPNSVETVAGSDPLAATSGPEHVAWPGACTNGLDDDRDGKTDSTDPGCQDRDGDELSNDEDTCPTVVDPSNRDADGDGRGDACDVGVTITAANARTFRDRGEALKLAFRGRVDAHYAVVSGPDCADGPLTTGEYRYDANPARSTIVSVPVAALDSDEVTVCLTALGETASASVPVMVDTTAPTVSTPLLETISDTGISQQDGVTNAATLHFTGSAEPGARVEVLQDTHFLGRATAEDDGSWQLASIMEVPEGTHAYQAIAIDAAGNASAPSDALPLLIDRTPPVLSASNDAPAEGTDTGVVTVAFNTDSGAAVSCSLDEGPVEPCSSPWQLRAPRAGTHTVVLLAEDRAGNTARTESSFRTIYRFTGFDGLANPPATNRLTAGSSLPLRFGLGGDRGVEIFSPDSPTSVAADCRTWTPLGEVLAADQPGARSLSYSPGNDGYQYVWKTDKAWAGTCRIFRLGLNDASAHELRITFR